MRAKPRIFRHPAKPARTTWRPARLRCTGTVISGSRRKIDPPPSGDPGSIQSPIFKETSWKASFTRLKEKVGQVTNNPDRETEGQDEKLAGKVQKKVGQVEKVLEK
jgi:uncharacterized protein YjbJ (UPF0337 family)